MTQDRWEHDITVHTLEQIEAVRGKLNMKVQTEPTVFCDARGVCFFDGQPDPSVKVLVSVLNEHGVKGWQLVQIDYGKDRLICTWRRAVRD